MFDAVQIKFLQRLVRERPPQKQASGAAAFFCDHYGIGVASGQRFLYRAEDFERARHLLRAHDLPAAAVAPGTKRADVARYGGLSEKMFSSPPHGDSVAVKALGDCSLEGSALRTPAHTYLVLDTSTALRVVCNKILLVENFESFRHLEDYRWVVRACQDWAVLVLFRGDTIYPIGRALEVVGRRQEAVWAFVDFDPAGLAMANALPRLERIVLPAEDWLSKVSDAAYGRQLFADQAGRFVAALEAATHPEVRAAWRLLRHLGSAVVQERMAVFA